MAAMLPTRALAIKTTAVLLLAVASFGCSAADTWKVVSVTDGDTIRVLDQENVEHKVRLAGIDAPERKQAFGTKAKEALSTLVKGKAVELEVTDTDKYGRTVAVVTVGGTNVNRELVKQGMAWHYTRHSDDAELAAAEREARKEKRGLWLDPEPVPPWEWRKRETIAPPSRRSHSLRSFGRVVLNDSATLGSVHEDGH